MKSIPVIILLIAVLSFAGGCDFGTYNKRFKERPRESRLDNDSRSGAELGAELGAVGARRVVGDVRQYRFAVRRDA